MWEMTHPMGKESQNILYIRKMHMETETRRKKCGEMSLHGQHFPQRSSYLEQLTRCFKVTWRAEPPSIHWLLAAATNLIVTLL